MIPVASEKHQVVVPQNLFEPLSKKTRCQQSPKIAYRERTKSVDYLASKGLRTKNQSFQIAGRIMK